MVGRKRVKGGAKPHQGNASKDSKGEAGDAGEDRQDQAGHDHWPRTSGCLHFHLGDHRTFRAGCQALPVVVYLAGQVGDVLLKGVDFALSACGAIGVTSQHSTFGIERT